MTKQTNIYLRLAAISNQCTAKAIALILMMIMCIGAWGQVSTHTKWIFGKNTVDGTDGDCTVWAVCPTTQTPWPASVHGLNVTYHENGGSKTTASFGDDYLFNRNFNHSFNVSGPGILKIDVQGYNSNNNTPAIRTWKLSVGGVSQPDLSVPSTRTPISINLFSLSGETEIKISDTESQHARLYSIEWTPMVPVYATEAVKWNYGWQSGGVDIVSGIKAFVNQEIYLNDYITTTWKTANANYNQGFRWTDTETTLGDSHLTGASITQQGVYKSTTTGTGKGSVFVKTAANTEVQSRFWIDVRDKDFESVTIEGVNLPAPDASNVITSEVANQTPGANYKLRYTLESTITDATVSIKHNGSALTAQTDGDGTYYNVELLAAATPNEYEITVSVGGNYTKAYTLKIINTTPPPPISSFTLGGGASQTFDENKKATNTFSDYNDGGTDKLLSITTNSSTATVTLSGKRADAVNGSWDGQTYSLQASKSDRTHTVNVTAPLAGNSCYYYIKVSDGGSVDYYELKLSTPAVSGGTLTQISGTAPCVLIADQWNSNGKETINQGTLIKDNQFQIGHDLGATSGNGSVSINGTNATYSLRVKGQYDFKDIALSVKANTKITVYYKNGGGTDRRIVFSGTGSDVLACSQDVTNGSQREFSVSYTHPSEGTVYISSGIPSGNTATTGQSDLYIAGIVVENEKFGTGITELKVNNNVIEQAHQQTSYEPYNFYYYGLSVPKTEVGRSYTLDLTTEATNPTVTVGGNAATKVSDYHFTYTLTVPAVGTMQSQDIVITSNSETKTYKLQLLCEPDLATVEQETKWKSSVWTAKQGTYVTNVFLDGIINEGTSDEATVNNTLKIYATSENSKYIQIGNSLNLGGSATWNGSSPSSRIIQINVSGKGTLNVGCYSGGDGSLVKLFANGNTTQIGEVSGASGGTIEYTGTSPASLYLTLSNNKILITSLTWIPNTDPIEDITFNGMEVTQNSYRQYALSTKMAGENLVVNVTKRDGYKMELSGHLTSAGAEPAEGDWTLQTGNTITLQAPTTVGMTWFYKLRVTPDNNNAPQTRAAATDGDIYVFAVTTESDEAYAHTEYITSGTAGTIPTGWKLCQQTVLEGGVLGTSGDNIHWESPGDASLTQGSRLFRFGSGGVTEYGFYLSDRIKVNDPVKQTFFITITPGWEPNVYIPKGKVRVTVLATGWEKAGNGIEYTIEDGAHSVVQTFSGTATKFLSKAADNGQGTNDANPDVITADKIEQFSITYDNENGGNYFLKIRSSNGSYDGLIVFGYQVELFASDEPSTDIQMVKVNNVDVTATRGGNGEDDAYTYAAASDTGINTRLPVYILPKSPTATVEICWNNGYDTAQPFRSVTNTAHSGTFSSNGNTLMVPNTKSIANYYCVKVTDNGQTAYHWIAVQRAADTNDSKVLGHHRVWNGAADFGYDGTEHKYDTTGVLPDGYIKYHTKRSQGVQSLRSGLYLSGQGYLNTMDRVIQLKVSGKGTLKVRFTNNNDASRNLMVMKGDETSATAYTLAGSVLDIPYTVDEPTSFYLYSSFSSMYINYLEWIPDVTAIADMPTVKIEAPDYEMEVNQSVTRVFATASYPYGDLSDKITYTVISGGTFIGKDDNTTIDKIYADGEYKLAINAGNTAGEVTIKASVITATDYNGAEKTFTIKVNPKQTSTKLKLLRLGTATMAAATTADGGDTYLKEVEANDESNVRHTMTFEALSSTAKVYISPALRATVTTPANLFTSSDPEASSATVYMPEAPGYSTYYYIKVEDDNETTAYHLVRLHRKAGQNDLEVWDQSMGWTNVANDGYNTWPISGTLTNASKLLDGYMYMHTPVEGRDVENDSNSGYSYYTNTSELWIRLAGSMSENSTAVHRDSYEGYDKQFAKLVAEIKVSGSGTLTVKREAASGYRALIVGVPNNEGGITETTLNNAENMFTYTGGPTSIFISSSHNNNKIYSLIWTPADAVSGQSAPNPANQPYLVWSGTEGFMYGTTDNALSATAYYHGQEVGGVTYKVVRGSENIAPTGTANGTTLSATDGELSLGGYHAGTVMVSASVPAVTTGANQRAATTSYYIFNVSKQTPTIIVNEITTTVGGNSAKTFKEYVTRVEGVKIGTSGAKETETISDRVTGAVALNDEVTVNLTGDGNDIETEYYTYHKTTGTFTGKKKGRGQVTLTWTPNSSHNANYLTASTTADVVVITNELTMYFTKTEGTGGCNRPYKAHVLCWNKTTKEKIEGLTIKYKIISDDTGGATYNADSTAIIPGDKPGTITLQAFFRRNPSVNDLNSYYQSTSTGDTRYFTLTVKDAKTLTMIDDKEDFLSEDLSSLSWENESRPSAPEVHWPTPCQFITDNFYYASADVEGHDKDHHHFRFYPSNRDEIAQTTINGIGVKGLYIKDKDSYLSFYARGSAVLQLKGYASVARVVEVWAINDFEWQGGADPHLEDGATKVADIKIPSGVFDVEQDLTVAGRNYYFLKTSFGGLYLTQVIWKHSRVRPYITISPSTYELTASARITNIIDDAQGHTHTPFTIKAWTYPTNSDTHDADEPGTGHIMLKDTEEDFTAQGVKLHFESTNPSIASINPVTSVITPNMPGSVVMYAYIDAGEIDGRKYGSQRTRFVITVNGKVADVFFGNDLTETSVIYSSKTGMIISDNCDTGGTWLTPTVRDAETYNTLSPAAYKLEYRLETLDGKPLSTSKATVDTETGEVTIKNMSDGEEFRVVVKFTSDIYVNQQSYYIVKYIANTTEPSVTYDARTGMKELDVNARNFDNAYPAGAQEWKFDRMREYFIPAEEAATLNFKIPAPLNGLTMHAKILEYLAGVPSGDSYAVPTSDYDVNSDNGELTVTIPAQNEFAVKYIWLRIYNGTSVWDSNAWNGAYKITFLSQPKFMKGSTASDNYEENMNPDITPKYATISSNNSTLPSNTTAGYYTRNVYYTTDSTTPTGESTPNNVPHIECISNKVFNCAEIFTLNNGYFTDGTKTFSTNVLYNQEIEITDNNVIEVQKDATSPVLAPNWNNQLLLPKGANAQTAELRMMMGTRNARILQPSDGSLIGQTGLRFKEGGVRWDEKGKDQDSGIPFYVDIYKYYKQGNNAQDTLKVDGVVQKENNKPIISKTYDSNPYTEYNGDFGGKGTNDASMLPYMTPISGAFFRFEPEYNGIVTVWIRQNGGSASSAWRNSHNQYKNGNISTAKPEANSSTMLATYNLTRRPVYIMDEDGRLLPNNTAQYSSGRSEFDQYSGINGTCADVSIQSKLDLDFMWGWNNYENIVDDGRKKTSRRAMAYYKMKYGLPKDFDVDEKGEGYLEKFDVHQDDDDGSSGKGVTFGTDKARVPITDIIYTDNPDVDIVDESFVVGGYEIPMPNYVRYRIPVKAGKTYFMGGRQTKNAFCAAKFEKFDEDNNTPTEINLGATNSTNTSSVLSELADGQLLKVTLNRTFTDGYWHPIVLPFSVSETKMREIFGDDVQVLYLDTEHKYVGGGMEFIMPYAVKTVTPDTIDSYNKESCDIMFTKHYYQMLYANTPAFIKPTFKWYTRRTNGTVNLESTPETTDPWDTPVTATDAQGKRYRESVTFNNVTYAAPTKTKRIDIGAGYDLVWTYDYMAGHKGDIYYIQNKTVTVEGTPETKTVAVIHHNNSEKGVNFKATTCWIERRVGATAAPIRRVRSASFDGEVLTGDYAIFTSDYDMDIMDFNPSATKVSDPRVYNLQGMVVATVDGNTSLESLRGRLLPGVYIFQGKKIAIK